MTAVHGYVDRAELIARGGFDGIEGGTLDRLIEAASRAIDEHCGRRFWLDTEPSARVFDVRHRTLFDLEGNDVATDAGLVVKVGPGNGTWPTTLPSSSYQIEPLNGVVGGIEGHAYTRLRAVGYTWPTDTYGRPRVQVTARWGWPAVPRTVQHVCTDLVRRATHQETGVQSESTGAYQVAYDFVGLRSLLSDGQKQLLAPYARVLA